MLLLWLATINCSAQVVINEVCSANKGNILDEDNDTPDWIELYNKSGSAIELKDWYLTDDSSEVAKWVLPWMVLQPGQIVLVFASGKNRYGDTLHTNFKLETSEETIYLISPDKTIIDQQFCYCVAENHTVGCSPDGSLQRYELNAGSPKFPNTANKQPLIGEEEFVEFSAAPGFYADAFPLELKCSNPIYDIRYTFNCSDPNHLSPEYLGPVMVKDRTNQKGVSYISTADEWQEPKSLPFRGTVVKAAAFKGQCRVSPIRTNTYFIGKEKSAYTFPVVSLVTDSINLFSGLSGIYVKGINGGENYFQKGDEWERPAELQYFDESGQLKVDQKLGVRIHGRGTRQGPQKSLRLYSRKKYGKETIDYSFFPDKPITSYKRLILKTAHGSGSTTFFKDELCAELVKQMDIDYQDYQPVVMFINGEYWGVQNLRERIDKFYFTGNHQVEEDNIDLLGLSLEGEEEFEGDDVRYKTLMNYIATHDLSVPENFNYLQSKIDLENLIDVHIAHLYLANYDWPRNNVRYWSKRTDDNQWRWVFFDCDFCLNNIYYQALSDYITDVEHPAKWLFASLLKSPQFKNLFVQRFIRHLNTTFSDERMNKLISEFQKKYEPMVLEHIDRWGIPESIASWHSHIEEMEAFAVKRRPEMMNEVIKIFGNPFTVYPNPAKEKIQVNITDIPDMDIQVKLYSITGALARECKVGSDQQFCDLTGLSKGLYLMQLQYGDILFSEKIVID